MNKNTLSAFIILSIVGLFSLVIISGCSTNLKVTVTGREGFIVQGPKSEKNSSNEEPSTVTKTEPVNSTETKTEESQTLSEKTAEEEVQKSDKENIQKSEESTKQLESSPPVSPASSNEATPIENTEAEQTLIAQEIPKEEKNKETKPKEQKPGKSEEKPPEKKKSKEITIAGRITIENNSIFVEIPDKRTVYRLVGLKKVIKKNC